MELGTRIVWSKIKGDDNVWVGKSGFGTLMDYGINKSLYVSGDYGLRTTSIKEIHEREGELVVITQNSVYELKEHK